MKKILSYMLILLLVSSALFAAPDVSENGGEASQGSDFIWGSKDFQQSIVNVKLVISDVLYAGFSSKSVTQFIPNFSILNSVEHLSETTDQSNVISSKPFFIFCLVSSTRKVSVRVDFAPEYKMADKTGKVIGKMNNTTDASKPGVPCELVGAPKRGTDGLSEWLLVKSAQAQKAGNDINVAWSYPDLDKGTIMQLQVLKSDIPANAIDSYRTILRMELKVE